MLVKRRRSQQVASSESEDASFTPGKSTKRARKTRQKDALMPGDHSVSSHTIQEPLAMRIALLKWYNTVHNNRGMPWRKPYDPNLGAEERAQRAYEVWISEIMLQQTQVVTVVPYYTRWMAKFPTIRDLADATIDEVNALWKGLGYYSRASRLLQGAQKVVKDFGGRLPNNARDLEADIPGIGRYSAGAISSIAYGEQVPALDGNVHRVMSRLLALHANPKAKSTLDVLWAGAKIMVEIDGEDFNVRKVSVPTASTSGPYPGDINQALIELGSTVCKVRNPECGSCPLKTWCSAHKTDNMSDKTVHTDIEDACRICEPFPSYEGVTSYPMKAERKKAREEMDLVSVIEWRSVGNLQSRHFLMVKRPEGGLLAGLYEFPSCVDVSSNITPATQEKMAATILTKLEIDQSHLIKSTIHLVGDVQHIFSHIKKTYRTQWIILESSIETPPSVHFTENDTKKRGATDAKWIPLKDVKDMNMGTGVAKIWNLTKKMWTRSAAEAFS